MLKYNLENLCASSTGVLMSSHGSALFSRLSKSLRKVLGYICSCWWGGGGGVATAMTEEVMQEPTETIFHGDGGVEKVFFTSWIPKKRKDDDDTWKITEECVRY